MTLDLYQSTVEFCYNQTMKVTLTALIIALLPGLLFAGVPTPGQAQQQQANVYGTYSGASSTWSYNSADPYLASRGFSAGNSYQQYGPTRNQNLANNRWIGLGVGVVDFFVSNRNMSFKDKVGFFIMDQVKRKIKDPIEEKVENLTLEQLFAMANAQRQQNTNQDYTQCVGCINQNAQSWQPTYNNPHAIGNQFSQFNPGTTGQNNPGLGGVVSPVQ